MAGRWEFNFASPVEEILKKPDFTLTQLLDEDDVVADTRNQKDALIAYFANPEIISKMLDYLVNKPADDADEKTKMRYPVVVTEVLSADVDKLQSIVLTPALFGRLLGFFKQPVINLLVANQVCKLLCALLQHQPAKTTAQLKADTAWVKETLNHLESAALHELWGKLWAQDQPFTTFLKEKGAVEILINQFGEENAAKHSDVAQMFVDIISATHWENAFVQALVTEPGASSLVALLNKSQPSGSRYVPRVLCALLRLMKTSADSGSDAAKAALDPKQPLDKFPALIKVLIGKLSSLLEITSSPPAKKLKMQDNVTVDAVGPQRIAILELLEDLSRLNFAAVTDALEADKAYFPALQELLFKFDSNNFVHKHVDHIYSLHITQCKDRAQFLKTSGIIPRILKAHETAIALGNKTTVQYIPYLYEIAKTAKILAEADSALNEYLTSVAGWTDFASWLADYMAKQQRAVVPAASEDTENFKPDFGEEGALQESNDAYLDGRDRDEDDLSLPDDVDLDSANDADDYDIEQAEILLTKQEIESFA